MLKYQNKKQKELKNLEGLTDLEKKLLPIAPNVVLKSILEKRKPKGSRLLTKEEVENKGFDEGTIVQVDVTGKLNVLKKPLAEEIKKRASLKTVDNMLNKATTLYDKLGKPY